MGTDPTNADAYLDVIRIAKSKGSLDVGWIARAGETYVVYARENMLAGVFMSIATNVEAGGLAPWYVMTNELTDATTTSGALYAVGVLP